MAPENTNCSASAAIYCLLPPSLLVTVCNCAPFVIASESVQLFAKNGGEEPVGSE